MGEAYIEIFSSPGCGNCPSVKKMLKEISDELEDDITIEEVNITVDPTRASQYGIMSVPAVAVNGILKFVGVPSREELKNEIVKELEA